MTRATRIILGLLIATTLVGGYLIAARRQPAEDAPGDASFLH